MKRALAWPVAALVAMAGCAAGPHYRTPSPTLPSEFAGARGAPAPGGRPLEPAAWWTSLGDPTLDGLIDQAVHANLDVAIAITRLQQARTYEAVIAGPALPRVDASAAAARGTGSDLTRGRAQQALVSADNASGLAHINELGGFDAVWQLDLFGKFRREIEAAHYNAQAVAAARNAVITTVIADVAHAYIDLRGLQMRAGVLRQAQAASRESLRIVTIRYERGITNELDVALAKREFETLQAAQAPLDAQISAAEYAIAVLLGQYPEKMVTELSTPNLIPAALASAGPGTPLQLLRRRPDIQEAERRLASATAHIGIATANLFPQLSLIASVGREAQGLGTLPAAAKHVWSFGPAALWPLLDFGALDAEVDIAQLDARAALLLYRKTIIEAVREVDASLAAYHADEERLRHVGEALLAAQRAVDLANQRYLRGLTDYLNVIDAERQYYDLQEQYAAAQVSQGEHFVELYKSLGGGWQHYATSPPIRLPQPAIIAAFRRLLGDPLVSPPQSSP